MGVLLAGWTVGCADTTTEAADAGGATECRNFAGAYIPQAKAACSNTEVIIPPLGACVSQDGCNLTIVTNQTTLKGSVTGASFTVSGTIGPELLQEECTGTRLTSGGIDLQCTVKAGSEQKAACSLPSDLMDDAEGASALCCDYNAQSCGTGQRCTAVNAANQSALPVMPTCIPTTGTKKLNEDCTRGDIVGLSNVGYDDCEAGLFCSGYGIAAGKSRVCRDLCLKSTDCPAGQACEWLGNDVPVSGVCSPSCDVFSGGCADTLACRRYGAVDENGAIISAGVCEFTGPKAVGEACGSGGDCQAGLFCNSGARKCVAYCDDSHPCDGGKTCNQFSGEPAGSSLGFCALE